jgi:O-acetyl-ADP-ribose deacetylase (regulator of RNase III)
MWEPFARLVLQAAYEATLAAAVVNVAATGNRTVFLTLLGGGVFGNPTSWITDAIARAAAVFADTELDVAVVSYGRENPALSPLLADFD